jgi:hypothetical protein
VTAIGEAAPAVRAVTTAVVRAAPAVSA